MATGSGRAVAMTDDRRVPAITARSALPADVRGHFDAIAASRGGVRGPFAVLLNRPELAERVADVGAEVRFEGVLPARLRETAILATAREWECAYIWAAHELIAREAGVESATIEAVAARDATADLPRALGTVVDFARELLGDRAVSEATFGAAAAALDVPGVTELAAAIGYYSLLACVCNALGVDPAGPVHWT